MARYRVRLSYHGGPFRGFAENQGVRTVAGELRAALETVTQHEVPLTCAGRTDAGVHALDQVVHFDTDRPVDLDALRGSLNSMCKPHIVVHSVEPVSDTFDARFSCTGRTYRYRVLNRRVPDAFRHEYTWRVVGTIDTAAMNLAGQHLLGTHDFSSFCKRQFNTVGDEPIERPRTRSLRSLEWVRAADDEIHLTIEASSFCQQMVRSITGVCVDVGLGRILPASVADILQARDRLQVPRVAPPEGLFLLRVDYPAES